MGPKPTIVLLAGPTASGKSKLAIKLSKVLNGEIVNADSMQVYKELKILTSRPSSSDLKKIKHHLYGFVSVKKNFSSGSWLNIVTKKIESILKKNFVGWKTEVNDISILHKGHNNYDGKNETHFSIILNTNHKNKESKLSIHRKINELLKNEFSSGLHALEIKIIN